MTTSMDIYAPSNGGELHIELLSDSSSFTGSTIYSSPNASTSSITMSCEEGKGCEENTIFAFDTTSVLDYQCSTDCDSTSIFCPNDAECLVECANSCHGLTVYTQDTSLLEIVCTEDDCSDIDVQCAVEQNGTFVIATDDYQDIALASNQKENHEMFVYGTCTGLSYTLCIVHFVLPIYFNIPHSVFTFCVDNLSCVTLMNTKIIYKNR